MSLRTAPIAVALLTCCLLVPAHAQAADSLFEQKTLFRWPSQEADSGEEEEDPGIVTDRPDFTEASSTVGKGTFQIESGYTYILGGKGADRSIQHSLPEALFRYGVIADWLELRAAWNYSVETAGPGHKSGADDLYLGFKLGLTEQQGALPEMALILQTTVPTGANFFSSNATLPGANWLYGWDINEFLATGGSTQVNAAIDGDETYTEFAQSWTINYTLAEKLGGYTEWFAFAPYAADTASIEHYFDGGITFRPTKNIQWDVRGGAGLNDAAADYFAGVGLSLRFR